MQLDNFFRRYGSLGAYGRSEQLSDRFIVDEMKQFGIQITFLPVVFLAVAVFLLNVVLRRIVATQRDQNAVLKAMGYSNEDVGLYYLGFALIPTAVGWLQGRCLVPGSAGGPVGVDDFAGGGYSCCRTIYLRFDRANGTG